MNKLPNEYQRQISKQLYADCPKAVLAAIAVSALTYGRLDEADNRLLREWWILYCQGIVPQKPTMPDPGSEWSL